MNPETLLKAYSEHAAEYRLEVQMGWDRYRNARDAFKQVEKDLGLQAYAMATTPGMLGAPWLHTLRITTAGIIVLLTFAVFDIALAVYAVVR